MIIPSQTGEINGGFFDTCRRPVRRGACSSLPSLIHSRISHFAHHSPRAHVLAIWICLAITLVASSVIVQASPVSANANWSSANGGWSGTGSVYLPGGSHVGGSPSQESSGCQGCRWEVLPLCKEGILNPCETPAPYVTCANGETRYMIRFGQGGAPTSYQDDKCIGPNERPVASTEIDLEVQDRVRQLAPTLSFNFQPSSRPVTQIPTLFRVGQPNEVARTDVIAGLSVRMRAEVGRVWQWGDGTSKRTNIRGGRWPDTSLSHTYRTAGTKRVRLTANWTAEYSVHGGRWIQVDGDPVQQSASRTLRVREARAQLVE